MRRHQSFIFLVVLFALATTTTFADILDQSSPPGGGTGIGIGSGGFLGQVYTAGQTGTLAGVNIATNGWGYPYTLSIYDVDGGAPGTTLLGQTDVGAQYSINDLITFPSAIVQIAGTQYTIVLHIGYPHFWELSGYGGDTYAGGHAFFSYDGTNWTSFAAGGSTSADDLYFRTWVDPVPEPATILLMGTMLGALPALRKRLAR